MQGDQQMFQVFVKDLMHGTRYGNLSATATQNLFQSWAGGFGIQIQDSFIKNEHIESIRVVKPSGVSPSG
jgi:hypothetical protein